MKKTIFLGIIAAFARPLPADTIVCTDGRRYEAVIASETERGVTVRMEGAEIVIPRSDIRSIDRSSPQDNARLEREWKVLDEKFKAESREAAVQSPPPAPTRLRDAEAAPGPKVPEEQIVFPAEPPAPPGESPPPVQLRVAREEEVRRAIEEGRVIPGMTPEHVQAAWGFPFSTAPVDNVDTHTDRWTYHRPEGRCYVYFENGKVVSVGR